jgi:hypothetical protein
VYDSDEYEYEHELERQGIETGVVELAPANYDSGDSDGDEDQTATMGVMDAVPGAAQYDSDPEQDLEIVYSGYMGTVDVGSEEVGVEGSGCGVDVDADANAGSGVGFADDEDDADDDSDSGDEDAEDGIDDYDYGDDVYEDDYIGEDDDDCDWA